MDKAWSKQKKSNLQANFEFYELPSAGYSAQSPGAEGFQPLMLVSTSYGESD